MHWRSSRGKAAPRAKAANIVDWKANSVGTWVRGLRSRRRRAVEGDGSCRLDSLDELDRITYVLGVACTE